MVAQGKVSSDQMRRPTGVKRRDSGQMSQDSFLEEARHEMQMSKLNHNIGFQSRQGIGKCSEDWLTSETLGKPEVILGE